MLVPFYWSDILFLPNDPCFQETLINGWQKLRHVVGQNAGFTTDGMIKTFDPMSPEYDDYVLGGELDEVQDLVEVE